MRPHLYKRSYLLVGPLVGPSVMLSSKSLKNGLFQILNDSDIAGQEEVKKLPKKMKKWLEDASLTSGSCY